MAAWAAESPPVSPRRPGPGIRKLAGSNLRARRSEPKGVFGIEPSRIPVSLRRLHPVLVPTRPP